MSYLGLQTDPKLEYWLGGLTSEQGKDDSPNGFPNATSSQGRWTLNQPDPILAERYVAEMRTNNNNGYYELGAGPELGVYAADTLSVMFWGQVNENTGQNQLLLAMAGASITGQFRVNTDGRVEAFNFGADPAAYRLTSNPRITLGGWHHYALSISPGSQVMLIDAKEVVSASAPTISMVGRNGAFSEFNLGSFARGAQQLLENGRIYDLMILSRPLTLQDWFSHLTQDGINIRGRNLVQRLPNNLVGSLVV